MYWQSSFYVSIGFNDIQTQVTTGFQYPNAPGKFWCVHIVHQIWSRANHQSISVNHPKFVIIMLMTLAYTANDFLPLLENSFFCFVFIGHFCCFNSFSVKQKIICPRCDNKFYCHFESEILMYWFSQWMSYPWHVVLILNTAPKWYMTNFPF